MSDREEKLWDDAQRLATAVLGKKTEISDPLAWWCLAEAIVGIAKR